MQESKEGTEYEEYDMYLVLNFKEKIDQKFFSKPNLFFKMVNLDTKNPYVQIGNHVFNGVYEDTLGTNLLFKEQSEPKPSNAYEKQTPIHLKYIGKSNKALTLSWQKIPDEIVDVDAKDLKEIEFTESYDTVLNKIENGSLDINSIIKRPKTKLKQAPPVVEEQPMPPSKDDTNDEELAMDVVEQPPQNVQVEKTRLDLLKEYVRKEPDPPEYYDSADLETFTTRRDFSVLKELYLKSLDYRKIPLITEKTPIGEIVDVKASIKDKIIAHKNVDELTDKDRQLLVSLNNFDNLSIPMKLTLLIEHLKEEKAAIAGMSPIELQLADEFGRTPKDRYRLLKSLANDLKYYMFLRVRDGRLAARSEEG